MFASCFFHIIVVEPESSMNNKIGSNQNGAMTFSWARSRSSCLRLWPSHDLKIKHVNIVKEFLTVPTSKYNHFGTSNKVGGVVKSSRWSTTAFWTLIPSHRYGIKSMQISENSFRSFSSKYDNSGPSKNRRMTIPWRWWRTRDLWLDPSRGIDIKNISIV